MKDDRKATATLFERADPAITHAAMNPHEERASDLLDPDQLASGLARTGELLAGFYRNLDEAPVGSRTPLDEVEQSFRGTLGEHGIGLRAALDEVASRVLPHAMRIPHPLYLGLINSSPLAGGIVAEPIISGLNNNAGAWEQGPSIVAAEAEVLRTFARILGLDEETRGLILPGGSYTVLHGLQLAREAKLPAWRSEGARALSGSPRVYVSDASHFSAVRAARTLGVADRDVVRIPTTGRGSMDPAALEQQILEDRASGRLPFAIVATLGTTGTGAIDPLAPIADLCAAFDLWLHVDACYGGAGALLDELEAHFHGIERADSVAVDPHKWFFVPMVAGIVYTRHADLELRTFDVDASYIPDGQRVDAFRRGLPTSRRGAGLAIWMALRPHGLASVREAVRRNCSLSRLLETRLDQAGFRVLPGGELSVVCARWEPGDASAEELDAVQERIARAVVDSGEAWLATVRARGKLWLRMTQVSFHTRPEHVDGFAERLRALAISVASRP